MTKIHELLAVEPELKSTVDAILRETNHTFSQKKTHFEGMVKTFHPVSEDDPGYPDQNVEMVTTVPEKLGYTEQKLINLIDVLFQKEEANTRAKADIIVNGQTIALGVPATVLLNLESKLKLLKQTYLHIPTLPPAERWIEDLQRKHTYVSDVTVSEKTQKIMEPVVMYEATKEHPAQVKEAVRDVRVGVWKTTKWSGMMAPVTKANLLEKVDELIAAVKSARCRANEEEVNLSMKIGDSIMAYLHSS